jgi:hypothetical protein
MQLAEEIVDEDNDLEYVLMKRKKGPNGEDMGSEESDDDEYGDEPKKPVSKVNKRKKKGRVELEFEDNYEPEQEAFEEVYNK